jgi:hypothetical protein
MAILDLPKCNHRPDCSNTLSAPFFKCSRRNCKECIQHASSLRAKRGQVIDMSLNRLHILPAELIYDINNRLLLLELSLDFLKKCLLLKLELTGVRALDLAILIKELGPVVALYCAT